MRPQIGEKCQRFSQFSSEAILPKPSVLIHAIVVVPKRHLAVCPSCRACGWRCRTKLGYPDWTGRNLTAVTPRRHKAGFTTRRDPRRAIYQSGIDPAAAQSFRVRVLEWGRASELISGFRTVIRPLEVSTAASINVPEEPQSIPTQSKDSDLQTGSNIPHSNLRRLTSERVHHPYCAIKLPII